MADQRVAFLCTVNRNGQCAVNHRGGTRGFVSLIRIETKLWIVLPDYEGNGAFEAIGNIWETHRAAIFVPNAELGYGVCASGPTKVFDGEALKKSTARFGILRKESGV